MVRQVLRFLALGFSLAASAMAQTTVVVPVEPGGGIDTLARLIAQHWTSELQVPTTVLNRTGASGNIGTVSVARAKADGQTLLFTGVSHVTSPLLHTNAGYDAIEDFSPVARFASAPLVILVGDSLKGMSLQQILQDPRSRQKGLSFGSAGYGHSSHIAAEVFMARAGVRWLHVPYKGNAPATRALMTGEVQILFLSATSVAAAVATGKVHPLAIVHRERVQMLPDIPTVAELGVRDAEFLQWYGLFAPAATPPDTVRALSALSMKTLQNPVFAAQLRAHGVEVDPLGHEQFARFVAGEQRRLDALLKKDQVERPVN